MTVPSTVRIDIFSGSDTTGPFPFDWRIFSAADIVVVKTKMDNTTVTLNSPTDYTLTLTNSGVNGGSITTIANVATGEKLTVTGKTSTDQETQFVNDGAFYGSKHETAFDKLTIIAQEQAAAITRSIQIPTSDSSTVLLPVAAARANKAVVFDGSGNVIASADNYTDQLANVTAQAAAAAASKTACDADVVLTHADVVLTHADVVLTHADVVLTHADVTTAAASATAAAASAATFVLSGTSTSTVTVATGSKSFTTQAGIGWTSGATRLRVATADASKIMEGQITAYSGTTVTINVDYTVGAGSSSAWNLTSVGTRGASGPGGGDVVSTNNGSDFTSASTFRTNLGLAIGTNVQAWDTDLDALAGLTYAADRIAYFTGAHAAALATFTSAARTLVAAADASAQRTALGLGTVATLNVGTSANNIIQLNGSAKLPAVDGSLLTNLPATGSTKSQFSYKTTAGSASLVPTVSSWTAATFNTTDYNNVASCTRSSNTISLPAGKYNVTAMLAVENLSGSQGTNIMIRIQNTTDATTIASISARLYLFSFGNPMIDDYFEIGGTKNIELQYYASPVGAPRISTSSAGDGTQTVNWAALGFEKIG